MGGNKAKDKLYRRHSGRPGGMKIESYRELQARIPERIVEKAIVGMLPKNAHGRKLFTHLKVYSGPEHPHEALPHRVWRVSRRRVGHGARAPGLFGVSVNATL